MKKYCLTFEEDGEIVFQQNTDNEPPRAGEWLDFSEFGVLGNFIVLRVQHQLGDSPTAYMTIYVEKRSDFSSSLNER